MERYSAVGFISCQCVGLGLTKPSMVFTFCLCVKQGLTIVFYGFIPLSVGGPRPHEAFYGLYLFTVCGARPQQAFCCLSVVI